MISDQDATNTIYDDTAQPEEPISSAEQHYGSTYDYAINTPPIHPLSPEQIEEPDLLLEDYTLAQDIRQAASGGLSSPGETPSTQKAATQQSAEQRKKPASTRITKNNARKNNETQTQQSSTRRRTKQPLGPREQRGGAIVEGFDTNEHEIQDAPEPDIEHIPTTIMRPHENMQEAIDGNSAGPMPRAAAPRPSQRRTTQSRDLTPEKTLQRPIGPGPRAQSGRTGYIRSTAQIPLEGDDALPPITGRPAQNQSLSFRKVEPQEQPPAQVTKRTANSVPLQMPNVSSPTAARPGQRNTLPRGRMGTGTAPLPPRSGQLKPAPSQTGRKPASPATIRKSKPLPASSATPRQRNNIVLIIAAILIILVLIIGALVYFLPTATVTLTTSTRSYSHAVSVTAQTGGGNVISQQLTQDFTQTGSEPATGSKPVGQAKATGYVCFVNNSTNANQNIEIPTGTIVTTNTGTSVQFATTADTIAVPNTSCANSPLVPVQAVDAGEDGNVQANSVTAIPDSSLQSIAQLKSNNINASTVKSLLTVDNLNAISGGGTKPLPAVTQQDLINASNDLRKKAQGSIDTWINELAQNGTTSNPTITSSLVNPPKVNTIINNGNTFKAQLQVHAVVLFVSTANLQKAALTQLNTALQADKTYSGYVIAPNTTPQIKVTQMKPQSGSNATTLKLNYTATAAATPNISAMQIQNMVAGNSPATAQQRLQNLHIPGLQQAKITVTPGFMPWIPYLHRNIHVTVQPGTTNSTTTK
jgi:hypothetical protein